MDTHLRPQAHSQVAEPGVQALCHSMAEASEQEN